MNHKLDLPQTPVNLLAKIGVDTAENEPLKSLEENSIHYSLASLLMDEGT